MKSKLDERLAERLIERVENINTSILKKIGQTIKEIKNLTPTQAHQLQQMIKYGASYQDILKKLSEITKKNMDEIDEMFTAYAKKDYQFAEDFYKYKNKVYKSYKDFKLLKQQVQVLSNRAKKGYLDIARNKAIGFTITDLDGKLKFKGIREAYQETVDRAVIAISQGKSTFDSQMFGILKDLGSGLKTIDYESGRTRRLDSALRMHLRSGLRDLHNETQRIIGEDFGADGVEITVHENPAPDHEDLQGKQFSLNKYDEKGILIEKGEFEKLQDNEPAQEYNTGEIFTHKHRPISDYNCYHSTFTILLGVSKPLYSAERLEQIKERNEKGFEFDGKHYTMYEGTQLQRRLETAIRKQKDTQILAKEADNKELIDDAQNKITKLTTKYKQLSNVSGLPMKQDRLRVSGYKRTKVEIGEPKPNIQIKTYEEWKDYFANKYGKFDIFEGVKKWDGNGTPLVEIKGNFKNADSKIVSSQLSQFEKLREKYNIRSDKAFVFDIEKIEDKERKWKQVARTDGTNVIFNYEYFNSHDKFIEREAKVEKSGYHIFVEEEKRELYPITHEFGHILERQLAEYHNIDYDDFNFNFMYDVYDNVRDKTGIASIDKIAEKYMSKYGNSAPHEAFAEAFAKYEIGKEDELTKSFKEVLEKYIWKK